MTTVIIYPSDSMSTIQSKLNKRGNIQFQNGVYKITKQLIIRSNSTVDLNGATLQRKGNIQSVFLNDVSKSTTRYNGASNITLRGGIIEGMGGYSYDNLVTFFHANTVTISGMIFRDALCHAIELNACTNVKVTNCRFEGYNSEGPDYAFREVIQIDHASAGGFFLSGSFKTSPCYDGTMCTNITIEHNLFTKSQYRGYPYACIGEHTQIYGGAQHVGITIKNNEFHCKRSNLKQPCLSIIEMKEVYIESNKFDVDKVARIYSKAESYKTNGSKVACKPGDGTCENVYIKHNTISCSTTDAFTQYTKSGKKHINIVKKSNTYNTPV